MEPDKEADMMEAAWSEDQLTDEEIGSAELSLEDSNTARIQALNAIGVGINGVNDALVLRMLERLLGPVATQQVKDEHQCWLSEMLDGMEEQVRKVQEQQESERRRAAIMARPLHHGRGRHE